MIPIYQPSSIYNGALSRNKQMHNSKKFNFLSWVYSIWLKNTLRPCFLAAGDNVLKFNCGSLFLFFGCVNIPFSTVRIFLYLFYYKKKTSAYWFATVVPVAGSLLHFLPRCVSSDSAAVKFPTKWRFRKYVFMYTKCLYLISSLVMLL